jgi:hypothetical protein
MAKRRSRGLKLGASANRSAQARELRLIQRYHRGKVEWDDLPPGLRARLRRGGKGPPEGKGKP